MSKISEIAKVIGEDNEQRLKDEITDIFISRVKDDLRHYDFYLMDYDKMFAEIQDEVSAMVKEKVRKKYMEQAEQKLAEFFDES